MPEYTIIDLLDIRDSMGSHWNSREKNTYEAQCSECEETVDQYQAECDVCGTPVIWRNSRAWKQLFGSPAVYEKRLLCTPAGRLGKWLCEKAGVERFPNPYALRRWRSALANLDEDTIRGIVDYCATSLGRRNLSPRGLISFVLNTTDQRVRALLKEEPDDEEPGDLVIEVWGEE